MIWPLSLAVVACSSFVLTWLTKRYGERRRMLDIPNERSSHTRSIVRGGGLSFVVTFLVGLPLFLWLDVIPLAVVVALSGAGVLVAVVGFVDDHHHVSAKYRFVVHGLAAGWALYWLAGVPAVVLGQMGVTAPSFLADVVAFLYIVWLLNLYNFMDGIDGIAGVEAITAGFGGALLYLQVMPAGMVWVLPASLSAAAAGFLCWNLPPARIFMGDVGSGFLGVTFAVLSLHSALLSPVLFWAWMILLGVFVVDATFTLLVRLARGQRFYEAHRTHAYQHAGREHGHRRVTLSVAIINLIWLLPLAWAVASGLLSGPWGLLMAYLPLVWLANYWRAGRDAGGRGLKMAS